MVSKETITMARRVEKLLAAKGGMNIRAIRRAMGFDETEVNKLLSAGLGYAERKGVISSAYINSMKNLTYYAPNNPPADLDKALERPKKAAFKVDGGAEVTSEVMITAPRTYTPVILEAPPAAPPTVNSHYPIPQVKYNFNAVVAGGGSMIVAKRDMKTLLDAVLNCTEHFEPAMESLILDLIARTA